MENTQIASVRSWWEWVGEGDNLGGFPRDPLSDGEAMALSHSESAFWAQGLSEFMSCGVSPPPGPSSDFLSIPFLRSLLAPSLSCSQIRCFPGSCSSVADRKQCRGPPRRGREAQCGQRRRLPTPARFATVPCLRGPGPVCGTTFSQQTASAPPRRCPHYHPRPSSPPTAAGHRGSGEGAQFSSESDCPAPRRMVSIPGPH